MTPESAHAGAVPVCPRGVFALFLLLSSVLAAAPAHAAIPSAQREALLDLYNSTNGSGWPNKDGWLGAVGTECSWEGVICNEGQTAVLEIRMPWNRLTGTLPATIGDLINLTVLHLYGNALSGTIPTTIGNLTNLQTLYLDANPDYS